MKKVVSVLTIICALFINQNVKAQTMEKDVTIIELIQTEGKFETQELNLTAGKYQFRVVNKNVDKDLGFAIQKEEDKDVDVMKTAIPNSFTTAYVKKGEVQYTGVVELEDGEYVYSCPLNPTPHYKLFVK
ncbi:hypothetical protein [Crocinitomix catalasitica]|uniref:hypothetical protein n=1 Tax=Crocinitomix catalasitica TaxID=184607 RepID=UPI0004870F86|nr:hypothetical protein [Crocinitomix catalasitica]